MCYARKSYIVRTVRIALSIRQMAFLRRALDLAIARSTEGLHTKSNACCVCRVLIRSAIAIFASGRVRVLMFLAEFCYSDTVGKLTGTCEKCCVLGVLSAIVYPCLYPCSSVTSCEESKHGGP